MSDELHPDQLPNVTVNSLYYLLGNLRHKWEDIGQQLISDHEVQAIKYDFRSVQYKSARCMIEMFDVWMTTSTCDSTETKWTRLLRF